MSLRHRDGLNPSLEGFTSESLALLRELGEQSSISGLVHCLRRIWRDSFGNDSLVFAYLSSQGQELAIKQQVFRSSIQEESLQKLLGKISLDQINYNEVFSRSSAEQKLKLFFLGYEKEPIGVFCWLAQEGRESLQQEYIMGQAGILSRWCLRLQKAQELLHRDDLTGLYNYRYLDSCLDSEIRRVQRFQAHFSLLFIDLDHFKPINDKHGHLAGSNVLVQVADLLREELRDVDSIFRYGGDEFVIMLLEADGAKASRVAERLRERIASYHFDVGQEAGARLTASIGIACCPEHSIEKEELMSLADKSMYQSKNSGKNQVHLYENMLQLNGMDAPKAKDFR